MGLPTGWVTDGAELTENQQFIALGNGVPTPGRHVVDASRILADRVELLRGDELHQLGVIGHDVVCDVVAVLLAE